MPKISLDTYTNTLDNYYSIIKSDCTDREKADVYYAIIGIKKQCKELQNRSQSLYLDVKNFVSFYLNEFYTEDYGYDKPNEQKLIDAVIVLPHKEQLVIYNYIFNLYEKHGYETMIIKSNINKLQMKIAFDEHHYASFLLRLSGQNILTLLCSYFIFLVIIFVVLLPAPFECMGILQIEPHDFGLSPFKNQIMNTLAIVTGGDYAPTITPLGLRGMFIIIIGKVLFYLLIGNFIVKKLVDIISFE